MSMTIINLLLTSPLMSLRSALLAERGRWLLWLPVGLAAGALAYFSLMREPAGGALLPLLGLPVLLRMTFRRGWFFAALASVVLCVLAVGFVAAKLATDQSHITMLAREMSFAVLRGQVVEIGDEAGGTQKLTIEVESIEGLLPEATPQRVRVSYRGKDATDLLTGERVQLRVGLLPPSGPVMPGAFDFARYFYFKGIGGVGYGIPPLQRLDAVAASSWQLRLKQARQRLSRHIRSQMAPTEGAIAAALMMGDRAGIAPQVNQDMRNANLSHILSISGMHMVILTGMIYVLLRYGMLGLPMTRHLASAKKIAAAGAMGAGLAYLLISGMPPSALRAWMMVAFLFGAVMLGREVMPMRSLALAACAMLVLWPPMVLDPGFQLSFVATAALVAWYEWVRAKAGLTPQPHRWMRRTLLYVGGILATSLVAEGATAPLVLYHFNNVALYGLLANLVVSPLVSFVMMPAIIVAYVLMPLGADGWALWVLEQAVHFMVQVAAYVSHLPYAQHYVRAMPGWACALVMLGMCWTMIWQQRWRWLGMVAVAAGMMSIAWQCMPDVYISQDGRQIAAQIEGELKLLRGRRQSFVPMQWANGNGLALLSVVEKSSPNWRCDLRGCVLKARGHLIAFSDDASSLAQDCTRAEVLVATRYLPREGCKRPSLRLDRDVLSRSGHQWLWFVDDGAIRSGNTVTQTGRRPWTQQDNPAITKDSPHRSGVPSL